VIISFIISVAFSFVNTDGWQKGFLGLNLALILISQIGCTVIAGSVFSIAALLPEARFTNAVVSAQAFSGIFTSAINIFSIAVGSSGRPETVGGVYFGLALVFSIFSLGIFFFMLRNPYTRYYMTRAARTAINDDSEPLIVDPQADDGDDKLLDDVGRPSRRQRQSRVVIKTLYHGLVLMMTMFATLTCFPSMTSMVRSTAIPSSTWHVYFIPVVCFLLFNTTDFIGRCIGNFIHWPKPRHPLIGFFALLRFGFIFFFLFCNLPPYPMSSSTRHIFSDDAYFVLFIVIFGLTNGYLANLAATYLPNDLPEEDREKAGAATAFYLAIGVLTGSVASLFIVKSITGTW